MSGALLCLGLGVPAEVAAQPSTAAASVRISKAVLRDKIRGGWAAQTIGVTFGGPTEFNYNGTFIQDYEPIPWYAGYLKETYERSPGLYDDVYVDLTFVDVIRKHGLDAPAATFAQALAGAEYMLWHANQMARHNVLRGLAPPASGHWRNNPEADDIDFQIEADFIGLMSPGLPNAATAYADKVGHIMNSGDGYYGGVFVAAMYSLAFVHDDVRTVVTRALDTIPAASRFHKTISAAIRYHDAYPDDWKRAWFELQREHSEDVGCPEGVFVAFDIDARINAAYVVLGLLYGNGDMSRTISVATRAGQDSDCNPATAAGVLGTILGYERIPAYWKQGLAEVEALPFKYTTISLNDAYALSYEHALEVVRRAGGREDGDAVLIPVQAPAPVALEQNFEGHHPVAEIRLARATDGLETRFEFDGIGYAIQGSVHSEDGKDHVLLVDVLIDGRPAETVELPTNVNRRRFIPFWKYELPDGHHTVRLRLQRAVPGASLRLQRAIIYGSAPRRPEI
ncbi:ADP-ribosylglycohydrolase family protein [Luteitalea sp. TBR-22]|uniref:ADP-ribosylglycohydrolase family protein n=1 Tax=Luteitalea sp. TBR-22 TaxID=2802971 RepID=UPI001EF4648F|nr:ADP-ribosylglycohydrolase family protein [Luteitalea sp. TBR-22]